MPRNPTPTDLLDMLNRANAAEARAHAENVVLSRQVAAMYDLHEMYLPAAVQFYCCGHCNSLAGTYVPWPCPTIETLDALRPDAQASSV